MGPGRGRSGEALRVALRRATSTTTVHYYLQGFTRSTDLIRLLSSPADAGTVVNTEVGPGRRRAVVAIRYTSGGKPRTGWATTA